MEPFCRPRMHRMFCRKRLRQTLRSPSKWTLCPQLSCFSPSVCWRLSQWQGAEYKRTIFSGKEFSWSPRAVQGPGVESQSTGGLWPWTWLLHLPPCPLVNKVNGSSKSGLRTSEQRGKKTLTLPAWPRYPRQGFSFWQMGLALPPEERRNCVHQTHSQPCPSLPSAGSPVTAPSPRLPLRSGQVQTLSLGTKLSHAVVPRRFPCDNGCAGALSTENSDTRLKPWYLVCSSHPSPYRYPPIQQKWYSLLVRAYQVSSSQNRYPPLSQSFFVEAFHFLGGPSEFPSPSPLAGGRGGCLFLQSLELWVVLVLGIHHIPCGMRIIFIGLGSLVLSLAWKTPEKRGCFTHVPALIRIIS